MSFNHEYPYVDPYRSNADWLINKVKEFGETLNSWEDTINRLVEALAQIDSFDARISALEEATSDLPEIREKLAALTETLADVYNNISRLDYRIDTITINYELVLSQLSRLSGLFPVYLALAENYTDNKVNELFIEYRATIFRLDGEIEELRRLRPSELYNFIRGGYHDLQTSYNFAYADMRDDAVTIAELDELGLTASEIASYNMTAKEFGLHTRTIFKFDYVSGAVSGVKKKVSHAISELLEFILGSFTASEFAALDLSCDTFEALDYSCIDFLKANDANVGLTVSQFSDIIISGGSNILRLE